jgi:hypothetical protein
VLLFLLQSGPKNLIAGLELPQVDEDHELIAKPSKAQKVKMDRYVNLFFSNPAVFRATILDPRIKYNWVKQMFGQNGAQFMADFQEVIKDELQEATARSQHGGDWNGDIQVENIDEFSRMLDQTVPDTWLLRRENGNSSLPSRLFQWKKTRSNGGD